MSPYCKRQATFPSDVSEAVDDGPRANWDPQVWNADYGDRWSTGLSERWCKIVKLSDRVEVEWFKQISPIFDAE